MLLTQPMWRCIKLDPQIDINQRFQTEVDKYAYPNALDACIYGDGNHVWYGWLGSDDAIMLDGKVVSSAIFGDIEFDASVIFHNFAVTTAVEVLDKYYPDWSEHLPKELAAYLLRNEGSSRDAAAKSVGSEDVDCWDSRFTANNQAYLAARAAAWATHDNARFAARQSALSNIVVADESMLGSGQDVYSCLNERLAKMFFGEYKATKKRLGL